MCPTSKPSKFGVFSSPPIIICYSIKGTRVLSQLLGVTAGTAGTQPLIGVSKKQTSNWGREGGSHDPNKNLNKLLKKLPKYAKEEHKNILLH